MTSRIGFGIDQLGWADLKLVEYQRTLWRVVVVAGSLLLAAGLQLFRQ